MSKSERVKNGIRLFFGFISILLFVSREINGVALVIIALILLLEIDTTSTGD